MHYDFSAFPAAVKARAFAKRRSILYRPERYPGEHEPVKTDAYLYALCEEAMTEMEAAAVFDGRRHCEHYA